MVNQAMTDKTYILKELKRYKNIETHKEFADILEITQQNLSGWYKRNTFDYNKVAEKFPEINRVWLLTGEGEMVKSSSNTSVAGFENQTVTVNISEIIGIHKGYQELLKTSQSQIDRLISLLEKGVNITAENKENN